ncbi:MAG: hypothetical protein IPK81_01955 [Rhodospirillales bacterium]|nr:MAG: hypothetical protein IPK81_01955 [Rhodospirillales bacterium]
MASTKTTTSMWNTHKPRIYALAVGLVAGPLISNMLGWQVTASAAKAQTAKGLVEQHATYCAARARAEVPETAKLDWNARDALAKKWAKLPGATEEPSYDVTSTCAQKLAG